MTSSLATPALDWSDTVTILRAKGKRLAKLICAGGQVADYDSPYRFEAQERKVAGLLEVRDLLGDLLYRPDCMVVRGELMPGTCPANIRRLAYRDEESGDEPTLKEKGRRWLALDADSIPRPDATPADDLLACADAVIEHLPLPFHRAACIVQATASHGIKPGCRLRLWYWCDRPMTGPELSRWLAGTPFDPSVFRTVQPIYTAAPIFAGGGEDHLPYRLIEWPGEDWLRCPSAEALAPPPRAMPATVQPVHVAGSARAALYVDAALNAAQNRIASAEQRHPAILSEACCLARFVRAGLLTRSELHAALWAGARAAGKNDEAEVERMVTFGLEHPDEGKLPEGLLHG